MKKIIIISIIAILIIAGIIIIVRNKPAEETGPDKVSVRLQWLHQTQFAGIYMAKEKGFYKDNNLDVTINPGGIDFPSVKMVASKGDAFGIASADQLLMAKEKGIPVKAIAVVYQKSPAAYASLKNSGITKPEDFAGKKVAIAMGSNTETIYRALMKKFNVDTKNITEIPYRYDNSILLTGQVDVLNIYTILEPYILNNQGYELNIIDPNDYGLEMYSDTIITSEDLINNNPDLVRRFLEATLKGWKYALTHQEETVATTLKYGQELDEGLQKFMLEKSQSLIKTNEIDNRLGEMTEKGWEMTQNILVEQKLLSQPLELNNVYTKKFLNEIYR